MESILKKLTELKFDSEIDEKKTFGTKLEENLKKTGLVYDSNYFNYSDNLKNLCRQVKENCLDKCKYIKARSIDSQEENILSEKLLLDKSLIYQTNNNFKIGSYLELINQILDGSVENGTIFLDRNLTLEDNIDAETFLTELILEKFNLKKILIVDSNLDSNLNLQKKFYQNCKVLYFSIHRFLNGQTPVDCFFDQIGEQSCKGFNINVSLDKGEYKNSDYMAIYYNILLPIAYEFCPDLILIPFRFNDINAEDLQNHQINTSPLLNPHLIHSLSCLADGKICLLINDSSLIKLARDNIFLTIRGLLGYPCPRIEALNQPSSKCVETILSLISVLRPYWCCLQLLNDNNESITLEEFLIENNLLNNSINDETQLNDSKSDCSDIENLSQVNDKSYVNGRTCMCSDEAMMQHFNLIQPEHPEKPDRIKRILETLKDKNLYQRCDQLVTRSATEDELKLCHPKTYIESIKSVKNKTLEELKELSKNPHSVYYHSSTFDCASIATGCLLQVVDQVCSNKYVNGVGVIRPPGHHAYAESCSGFCFFNSVAVAARYAQKKYSSIRKVLILDFDVHHGNGTQDIFIEDDSVLFISIHRYDNGCFYPVDADSNYDNVGRGKGKGFNINIPWSQQTSGDAEYTAAFLRIVMPVAYQFNPDLVLVSAGFDGATGDPLGRYNITPNGFAQMTKMLCSLANGNVILGLEGGYNLTSISESMSSCVSILLGDKCPSVPPINAKPKSYETIKNVISVLKEYWSCFKFDQKLPQCEFKKNFKPENKVKEKPIEIPYSLRSRNNKQNENSKDKPTKNTENKKSNSKLVSGGTATNLKILNEDEIDDNLATAFSVIPLPFCPHLLEINKNLDSSLIDVKRPCYKCKSSKENWICLSCFECGCSRFIKEHMAEHYKQTKHPMVLSFSDLSVWCYECDSYVHNDILTQVKQLAYTSKFG